MKLFYLFFVIITFSHEVLSHYDNSWHWNWSCNTKSGQCEKSSQPVIAKHKIENPLYSSQNVCRLTCGKYGALWPVPTIVTTFFDNQVVYFHPSAINYRLINGNPTSIEFFKEITNIFNSNLETECGNNCVQTTETNITILVDVNHFNTNLLPDTDESYQLEITTKVPNVRIRIFAETLFGARHGFETLTQLVASYKTISTEFAPSKNGLVMVANALIKDKPVYKHRGLLLDTARNYLPISSIKKQIDAMAASKMNVLHWHATDSQSFPIVFKRVPQMSRFGAYSSEHVYHLAEIAELLLYAKHRGIRIIFELDQPSHAGNGWQWGSQAGFGNLAVCVNKIPWRQYCIQPPCGQLNPSNNNVYNILGELYKDILDVFPSKEYFHMGGDEVFMNCWNATEEITSYMESKGWGRNLDDFLKLWAEFQENSKQAYDNVVGTNETPIILWSSQLTEPEHIEKYLSKDRYVIQTWVPTTNELPTKLLEKGYRLIISTKNAWYLDHGFWGTTLYYNWRTVYKNKIPRHEGVLGGEACMWGEYVDENSIDAKIWPRVAAVAERLWSDPSLDTGAVETRFYRHRERLVTRGINADALAPGWCSQNEGECQ